MDRRLLGFLEIHLVGATWTLRINLWLWDDLISLRGRRGCFARAGGNKGNVTSMCPVFIEASWGLDMLMGD